MAKFITTTEISFQIEKMIEESSNWLLLISPFIKLHKRLETIIKRKITSGLNLFIICRENNESTTIKNWVRSKKVNIYYHNNLHGKCYLNETSALVTSINLYEFSMVNNIEFGIIAETTEDAILYNSIKSNILNIFNEIPIKKNSGNFSKAWKATRDNTTSKLLF